MNPITYSPPADLIEFIEQNTGPGIKAQLLISIAMRNLKDSFKGLSETETKAKLWDLAKQAEESQEPVKKRSRG